MGLETTSLPRPRSWVAEDVTVQLSRLSILVLTAGFTVSDALGVRRTLEAQMLAYLVGMVALKPPRRLRTPLEPPPTGHKAF